MDPLSPLVEALHSEGRLRVWSLVITVFGDLVQHRGGQISTARLGQLLGRVGNLCALSLMAAAPLDLVGQIAELGARSVGLIGGEAYLRKDWLQIIAAVRAAKAENNVLLITYTDDQAIEAQKAAPDLIINATMNSADQLDTLEAVLPPAAAP